MTICKACGAPVAEKFCGQCGQATTIKRITFKGLLHDVFHFFTHIDKGILYTLKRLLRTPGTMQREFIEGDRARYQKPFSMFFISVTAAALLRYWINLMLIHYFHSGSTTESAFVHNYLAIFHIILVPLYALVIFLFFYRSRFNYAEIGVLTMYTLSFFFVTSIVITLLKFLWHNMDTGYIELPVGILYCAITFKNFFHEQRPWLAVLKGVAVVVIIFFLANITEDFVIDVIADSQHD